MKIQKDQIVAITTGEYSDYYLNGHMKALRDFDRDAELERFMSSDAQVVANRKKYVRRDSGHTVYTGGPVWSCDMFISWLQREGFLEPLADDEVVEFYIPSSGN